MTRALQIALQNSNSCSGAPYFELSLEKSEFYGVPYMKEGLYNSIFQYSKIVLASVRLGMILLKAFFARNVSCSTIGIELHM